MELMTHHFNLHLGGPLHCNMLVFTEFVSLDMCDLVSVEKSDAELISAHKSFADLS